MGAMTGRRDKVFGIRIDTQRRRRGLVVGCYGFLLVVVVLALLVPVNGGTYGYAMYALLAVNAFALGGYAGPKSPGLVKAFANKPPRDESVRSELIRVNLASATGLPLTSAVDEEFWRNDERELARRDAVHYQAYQVIVILLLLLSLLAMWSVHRPSFLPERVLPMLLLGVALPSAVLAMTLPQAILLWTEPELGD